jgi:hypothetical protein
MKVGWWPLTSGVPSVRGSLGGQGLGERENREYDAVRRVCDFGRNDISIAARGGQQPICR